MTQELKTIEEAIDAATQRGAFTKNQVVQLDHCINVINLQLKEAFEMKMVMAKDLDKKNRDLGKDQSPDQLTKPIKHKQNT